MGKVEQGLEIIDIHDKFGFKSRRGMLHWEVCGTETITNKVLVNEKEIDEKKKVIKVFKSFEEVGKFQKIKSFMFPPPL